MHVLSASCVAVVLTLATFTAGAAQGPDYTERYKRAASIEAAQHEHWALNQVVVPSWVPGQEGFWYKKDTLDGERYVFVDAATGAVRDLFDHQKLAEALSAATGSKVDPNKLDLARLRFDAQGRLESFETIPDRTWSLDFSGAVQPASIERTLVVSPDRKLGAFVRDNNLWVRDLASGKERALTKDGQPSYAYGLPPSATGRHAAPARVIWSPDSKRIFTAVVDERLVGLWPILDFAPAPGARPTAAAMRTALPGDQHTPTFQLVLIDADGGNQTVIRHPPLATIRMYDTPFEGSRAWWSGDSRRVIFVDVERGEKVARVLTADAQTGETRELFREVSDLPIELGPLVYTKTGLRYLPKSDQLIWYSDRSGAAQLYLYDLKDGKLVRPLTQGPGRVRDVLAVDEDRREVFVSISGREQGKNPYFREIARVGLDSGRLTIVSKSDADHLVQSPSEFAALVAAMGGADSESVGGVSPSRKFYVETRQRPDGASVTELHDREGRKIADVDGADLSRMPKQWRWPEPVKGVAADGKTDIRGLVFYPSDLDPKQHYPVIDYVYGGPQVAWVPQSISSPAYWSAASLAELGFIVTLIDGRGTTDRDRAFATFSYGHLEDASFVDDHIAMIKQLARERPAMDLDRVGITGFSGGGYMTAMNIFRRPDFYKVGVAGAGNYDQRLFWHTWGERYQGLLKGNNYEQQAAATHASGLKGKLLLFHGLQDSGVHPSNLFQLVDALSKASKDYDLLIAPSAEHQAGGYNTRRRWDYFVQYLAGAKPPADFPLKSSDDYAYDEMKDRMGKTVMTDKLEAR